MATITGRFGAVQRLLPKRTNIIVNGGAPIPIWGWNGFEYERVEGKDTVISWYVLDQIASRRTDKKARIQASGREPDNAAANPEYSNMVSAVQSWGLDLTAQTQTYTASNLLGFNAKYAGAKSCSGSFQGVGAFPPVRPGDRFLFLGFTGPENAQD
jgi:hypothetical protein